MITFDFSGKTALVTGGTRGIGAAISRAFLDAGARVVALYGSNRDAAASFRAALPADHVERLTTASLDVAQYDAVEAFFEAWEGSLDVLVNNAGIRDDAIVGMMTPDQWRRVLSTNLDGSFYMARGAVRLMSRARRGRILNIISPSARLGMPGQANYAASKAGQEAMTRSLAQEVAKRKITVNCVSPGFVATDLIADLSDEQRSRYEQMVPLRRFGQPEEIARAVLFLATDEAGYITGTTLDVAGGL